MAAGRGWSLFPHKYSPRTRQRKFRRSFLLPRLLILLAWADCLSIYAPIISARIGPVSTSTELGWKRWAAPPTLILPRVPACGWRCTGCVESCEATTRLREQITQSTSLWRKAATDSSLFGGKKGSRIRLIPRSGIPRRRKGIDSSAAALLVLDHRPWRTLPGGRKESTSHSYRQKARRSPRQSRL